MGGLDSCGGRSRGDGGGWGSITEPPDELMWWGGPLLWSSWCAGAGGNHCTGGGAVVVVLPVAGLAVFVVLAMRLLTLSIVAGCTRKSGDLAKISACCDYISLFVNFHKNVRPLSPPSTTNNGPLPWCTSCYLHRSFCLASVQLPRCKS